MPSVHGGADEHGYLDEWGRRTASQTGSVATVTPQIAAPQAQQPQIIPTPNKPQKPSDVIDRLHKYGGGPYGAFVYLGHDHSRLNDSDQAPPDNPGYRSNSATASSIVDAMQKAESLASECAGRGRVCIKILGGTWNEPLNVNIPGIDVIGTHRCAIDGQSTVGGRANPLLESIDFVNSETIGDPSLRLFSDAFAVDPLWPTVWLRGCRGYADQTAMVANRRFFAEHCDFFQMTEIQNNGEVPAVEINGFGPELGYTEMKDCGIYAYRDVGALHGSGIRPKGVAIAARAQGGQTYAPYILNQNVYVNPSAGLVLRDCYVYGSLINRSWRVHHIGGAQFGGLIGPGPQSPDGIPASGWPAVATEVRFYLRSYGHPLFDPVNGYYADAMAYTTFDKPDTYAECIAEFAPYDGIYPAGVVPAQFPGKSYVQYRNGNHHQRFDQQAGSPWIAATGVAAIDVVSSSTGAQQWLQAGTVVTTYGNCSTNVRGLVDLYYM